MISGAQRLFGQAGWIWPVLVAFVEPWQRKCSGYAGDTIDDVEKWQFLVPVFFFLQINNRWFNRKIMALKS